MDYLKKYVIPFGGLKLGSHHFSFEIDDAFLEHFEHTEIKKGSFRIEVILEKEEKVLSFTFLVSGKAEVTCDRCSEPFLLPVSGTERLIVKFGDSYHEENDEVQIIPLGENQIDVSPFIYEYVHLLLPVRRVHPEDESGNSLCDPEIIRMIEEGGHETEIDPRWEVLKKLRSKK
jgi:uncharacterized metal-binding protein YceD (DUF177 family)